MTLYKVPKGKCRFPDVISKKLDSLSNPPSLQRQSRQLQMKMASIDALQKRFHFLDLSTGRIEGCGPLSLSNGARMIGGQLYGQMKHTSALEMVKGQYMCLKLVMRPFVMAVPSQLSSNLPSTSWFGGALWQTGIVPSGPVRSGLLALFPKDWDCNQSYWSYISLGPRPNCGSLINCSLYRL